VHRQVVSSLISFLSSPANAFFSLYAAEPAEYAVQTTTATGFGHAGVCGVFLFFFLIWKTLKWGD
jgi:hypothetical protein